MDAKGSVELRPLMSPDKDNDESMDAARRQYIRAIADRIDADIKNGAKPHDIMVLVQRRNPYAAPLVKELKNRGIPVAGSDRIVLPEFPAIRDLLYLTRFCLDNSDDYSLACVLKSPMFRFNEKDLYEVCAARKNTPLFDIIRDKKPQVCADLQEIVEWSKILPPYSFFMRVLGENNRRKMIISTLGDQVVEPLEEFLTQCLSYERTQSGMLREWIKWFVEGGSEIKRELSAADGIRIATVHGSKGLEAKTIFLIDTITTPRDKPAQVIKIKNSFIWVPKKSPSEKYRDAANSAMQTSMAEYYRLLYVAMTRARDNLIIFGFGRSSAGSADSWHNLLAESLAAMSGAVIQNDGGILISNA
jgi:ATP-dependent helicase/nuclease subunit A